MSEFKWKNVIDHEIDKEGVQFMYGVGSQDSIQQFCEDLSNLIGFKCDWAYAAGRFRMKVLPEGLDAVRVALQNRKWLERYVKKFDPNDRDYFEPYILPCAESFPEDAEKALTQEENDYKLVEEERTVTKPDGQTITEIVVHRVGI